jgi:hypothetical protein
MASPVRVKVGEVMANECATMEAIASYGPIIEVSALLHAHPRTKRYNDQIVQKYQRIKLICGYNVDTQRSGPPV